MQRTCVLLISKQSILLPSFCIILVSAAISSIAVLNESQHLDDRNSTLVKESPVCMKVKMLFFHICGVLPTITVHVVTLMSAFRYYKDTNMKFTRQSKSSNGKRFRVLYQSFQFYFECFYLYMVAILLYFHGCVSTQMVPIC